MVFNRLEEVTDSSVVPPQDPRDVLPLPVRARAMAALAPGASYLVATMARTEINLAALTRTKVDLAALARTKADSAALVKEITMVTQDFLVFARNSKARETKQNPAAELVPQVLLAELVPNVLRDTVLPNVLPDTVRDLLQ